MFWEFKQKLRHELSNDLPGEAAHLMMMPSSRDDALVMPEFKSPPVSSAVLILFYPDRHGRIKFPLIQRPTYNGAHSGQVALPGGKSEFSDPDLTYTALRETKEEIGVAPHHVEVIGSLTELHISVSNFIVRPFVGFTDEKPDFVLEKLEVEALIESDIDHIINPEKRKEGTIMVRGKYKIDTPYFDIENKVVWGATAMMLSELSLIISKTGIV